MTLRKHQKEIRDVTAGAAAGSGINTVWGDITPGGGKSLLPLIAGANLIASGFAERLCWVAPRLSLLDQAEREFTNPDTRRMIPHNLRIRSATNDLNPCRGLNGIATTYQAIGVDEQDILRDEFRRHRYILILDEPHHVEAGSLWHHKLQPLWDLAAFRLPMSGTFERGDGGKIAFLPYKQGIVGIQPNLQDGPTTKVIRYGRRDALREKAIIPLSFHLSDGQASWTEEDGKDRKIRSLERLTKESDITKAIFTALKTEFAEHLAAAGIAHWQGYRRDVRHAKCLVVCSDIAHAERTMALLKSMARGIRMDIATSSDSSAALAAINALKRDQLDLLVTVAMAYEGMSCESISHEIILTRIRSTPWIYQCTARANRIDRMIPYKGQMGYIFAPADPFFRDIVRCIEQEQTPILKEQKTGGDDRVSNGKGDGFGLEPSPGGIKPLSSSMTDQRRVVLDDSGPGDLFGYSAPMSSNARFGADLSSDRTQREIETDLRAWIETHVREYCRVYSCHPGLLNRMIREKFGKNRETMTVTELERVKGWLLQTHPIPQKREPGMVLVPVGRGW